MPLSSSFPAAAAVSGVAEADLSELNTRRGVQVTIIPGTASGTGTVTVKPAGTTDNVPGYETLYQDGVAMTVDLSAQVTFTISGDFDGLKVESDNSADTFTVIGG